MKSLRLWFTCLAGLALGLINPSSAAESGISVSSPRATPGTRATVSYRTLSQWRSGFVGEVTLTNTGSLPVELWRVEVGLDAKPVGAWGARLLEAAPGQLTFGHEFCNPVLRPGQTTRFGFLSSTALQTTDAPSLVLKDINDDIAAADATWQQWVDQQQNLALQESWAEFMVYTFTRFESLTPARVGFDLVEKDPLERAVSRRFERVRLQSRDGLSIKAVFLPVPKAKGTLIMLHGFSNTYFETLPLAQLLAERGYQIFAFNSREWNFYQEPQRYFNDIRNDATDIASAVQYLRRRRDVDGRRIGVMGYSYGCSKALLATPVIPELKVVILEGANAHIPTFNPAIPLEAVKEDFLARYAARLRISPDEIHENIEWVGQISPRAVMIIHGQNDPLVPVAEGQELYATAGQPKSFLLLPQSGHVDALSTPDRELYLNSIAAFLDRYLAPLTP